MGIYIPKALVDAIISKGPLSSHRLIVVIALAAAYAASALLFWMLDYKHVDLRGRSGSRKVREACWADHSHRPRGTAPD